MGDDAEIPNVLLLYHKNRKPPFRDSPDKAQRSGFGRERTSSERSEPCPKGLGEGSGACEDEIHLRRKDKSTQGRRAAPARSAVKSNQGQRPRAREGNPMAAAAAPRRLFHQLRHPLVGAVEHLGHALGQAGVLLRQGLVGHVGELPVKGLQRVGIPGAVEAHVR